MIRVMHFLYSFHMGGLENVVVQLINRLPRDDYRHCLVALTGLGAFVERIERPDVELIALDKGPGHAVALYPRIMRLLRRFRPHVLHSCNLAALEAVPLAWLAGVPRRVHAEHGWDASDPRGENPRYQRLRRLYRPFVSHYVSVSADLDAYLGQRIQVPERRRCLIPNGLDTELFRPAGRGEAALAGCPFTAGRHWLLGTVGRLQTVKNQPLLAHAFVRLLQRHPAAREYARLVIVGEGPLRAEVERILLAAGVRELAWLPGARADIPAVLRALDCFVLPSQTEGTSCTLQEAMASGLPCVATAVGGTPELLSLGATGTLVPGDDPDAMAQAIQAYLSDPVRAGAHGRAARERVVAAFGIDGMVGRYDALFRAS